MEDMEGNEIKNCQDIGTKKYNLIINNLYFVDFKENGRKTAGVYCREGFQNLGTVYILDTIVVSDKKENARIIDGKINLKSFITKLLSADYKFYKMEIVEIKEEK